MKPPASPEVERRRKPRYDVVAQANIKAQDETYLLTVANLSASGAFLEGNPTEHPDLMKDADLEIVLSCAAASGRDEDIINIRCSGRVARVVANIAGAHPAGFGVMFTAISADNRARLETVIGSLAGPG